MHTITYTTNGTTATRTMKITADQHLRYATITETPGDSGPSITNAATEIRDILDTRFGTNKPMLVIERYTNIDNQVISRDLVTHTAAGTPMWTSLSADNLDANNIARHESI